MARRNKRWDSVLVSQETAAEQTKDEATAAAAVAEGAQIAAQDALGATAEKGGRPQGREPQRAPDVPETPEIAKGGDASQTAAENGGLVVTVYAIALNEEKFAKRWMDSMGEADHIVVLDTGSSDNTASLLRSLGATVEVEKYERWETQADYDRIVKEGRRPHRFDVERNQSMRLIPTDTDICVCTDLDEVLCPGWRAKLEAAWRKALDEGKKPTTGTYEYVWGFNADGSEASKFTYKKVHAPGVCKWTHPVHEVLDYGDNRRIEVAIPGMRLEHHSDPKKSRSSYLHLLELSVREAPEDDRNAHYLGREYMFRRRWDDSIGALKHHLSMPTAKWNAERAASMRYIARCLKEQGKENEAVAWLTRAIEEAPDQREAAVELAELAYSCATRNLFQCAPSYWSLCVFAARRALAVTERSGSYLSKSENWGYKPHDYLALGLWNIGDRRGSYEAAKAALAFKPDDARLQKNLAIIEKALK